MFLPMRLAEESEEEHRLRLDLYAKQYEVEDAIRQMHHLQAVIEVIDDAWGNSVIPPRTGRDKINVLQAEASQFGKQIKVMEAELKGCQDRHDTHFKSKVDLDLEKALQKDVETLTSALWTAPAEQLEELRDKLVELKSKLKEIAEKNASAVKTVKKGGRKGNTKKEQDQDEDEGSSTVLPSDESSARTKYLKLDEDKQAEMQGECLFAQDEYFD